MLAANWGTRRLCVKKCDCLLSVFQRPTFCNYEIYNLIIMEKKVFGIILTILGIAGLIAAAVNFVNAGSGSYNVKMITVYLILGLIFFFTGIGLIRTTKDRSA